MKKDLQLVNSKNEMTRVLYREYQNQVAVVVRLIDIINIYP